MDYKRAAVLWEVNERKARKICKALDIDPKSIPTDTVPIYLPDRRYKANPHRYYIFVLDVIANTHLELQGFDATIIETCVEQLRHAGLIVLKRGKAENSVDYRDYIISPNREVFENWKTASIKNKIDMIAPLVPDISIGLNIG